MKDLAICILATVEVLALIYVLSQRRVDTQQPTLGSLLDNLENAIQTRDPKAAGWARMVRERTEARLNGAR